MEKSWLNRAVALLSMHQNASLVGEFCQALMAQLPVWRVLVLTISPDGRVLTTSPVCGESMTDAAFSFDVDDFSHPLSHVLQTDKVMRLDKKSLAYWQDHTGFLRLSGLTTSDQMLLLYPLADEHKTIAILCLWVDRKEERSLLAATDWQEFGKVFVAQWRMLNKSGFNRPQLTRSNVIPENSFFQLHELKDSSAIERTLVGNSDSIVQLRREVTKGAALPLAVMILGETGTGKEVVGQTIHDLSDRRDKPFVAINCAAIPENLLESELFGYTKGAFSGAIKDMRGLIAQSHQGTLFLDEIGDMPLGLQSKLLRVLESRHYRPLGSHQELFSDFRLVTATHVDLKAKMLQREFRQDLYYRLCQYPINLAPLRARKEDIAPLTRHFIDAFNHKNQRHVTGIDAYAQRKLEQYDFPGNVRELRNLVEYACALAIDGQPLIGENLPLDSSTPLQDLGDISKGKFDSISNLRLAVAEFERAVIESRLRVCDGDRSEAASSLALPKRTLYHKCKKLEINE